MTNKSVETRVRLLTWGGLAVVFVVAAVSARTSYGHIVAVSDSVGEAESGLIPFSVDGMMIAGAAMAAVDRLRGYEPRRWSTVALWLGTMMTFAFNIASAWDRGLGACAVAAVPAVALVVSVEAAFKPSRRLLNMAKDALAAVAERSTAVAAPVVPVGAPEGPTVTEVPDEPVSAVSVPLAPPDAPVRPRRARKPRGTGKTAIGMDTDVVTTDSVPTMVG